MSPHANHLMYQIKLTDSDRDEWPRPGGDPGSNAPDDGDEGGDGGNGGGRNVWVGGNYHYGQGSCGDGMPSIFL